MIEYILFIGLLTVIYAGYKIIQLKEKRRMNRYYGYRRKSVYKELKKAA